MLSVRALVRRTLLALGVAAVLWAPGARGANLDEALLSQTTTVKVGSESRTVGKLAHVLNQLSLQHGYTNVGVLPFKVQKGKGKASYVAAPLATLMPPRLETAMLMVLDADEKKALGIISDAAGTASRNKVGAWHYRPEAFNRLFATTYRLPWGNKAVKADAFITGQLICLDGIKTTVVLEAFDRKSLKGGAVTMKRLATFTVENDRALLRDLGLGFVLPPSALARGATAASRDRAARAIVARQLQGDAPKNEAFTPDDVAGMQVELLYNGSRQALSAIEGEARGQFAAPSMVAGTEIALALKRVSDDKRTLGVVIKVNGRSTWNKQEDVSINCQKWIYKPESKGRVDRYEGFYMGDEGKDLLKFKVLTEAESPDKASELGERAGWIDVDIFATGDGGGGPTIEEKEMKVTLRGVSRRDLEKAPPKTLKELQDRLRKANNVAVKPRPKGAIAREGGLLLHDLEPVPSTPPGTAAFPNPVRIGGVSIRYYDRPKGNGVLKVTPD